MANEKQQAGAGQERYIHGYETQMEFLAGRTAVKEAAFFLPHLRPGMSLIDCGCGPGEITIGLAEIVSPGQVVGIDIEESQVELASENTSEKGVSNARFQVASIYELPFPDSYFDAAFAHTALQHLKEPVKALKEIYRVLKPGGVVGVREEDFNSSIIAPSTPLMEECLELYQRLWRDNGGDPSLARRHREILRESGFKGIVAAASAECWGTPQETIRLGELLSSVFSEPLFVDRVVEHGWVDRQTLEQMAFAIREWGQHTDAYMARIWCEAVGWKE